MFGTVTRTTAFSAQCARTSLSVSTGSCTCSNTCSSCTAANRLLDKASIENERNALHLRTSTGRDVTCVQIAGLIARRILCYVKPGDTLARGQRYGFIRFGSRVDVYMPLDARPNVAIGDAVYATETVLAELPSA